MKHEKSCGAVIFKKVDGELYYLSIRSKRNNHWGFPKGHVEVGEQEQETAIREIMEETGLKVNLIDGFRTKIEYLIAENIHKEVVFFTAEASTETVVIEQEEISDFKWQRYEEMIETLTYVSCKNVLKEVKCFLNGKTHNLQKAWLA